jgi:hypothetical protein
MNFTSPANDPGTTRKPHFSAHSNDWWNVRKRIEIWKKTGLETLRPHREQQRMANKKRLARSRQGLVLRHSHDATSCGRGVWISGTGQFNLWAWDDASKPAFRNSIHPVN